CMDSGSERRGGRMIRSRMVAWSVIAGVFFTASGCYTTSISAGPGPAAPASEANSGKWHSGFVFGVAEVSGPHDLDKMCPQGWGEVTTETSFLNGLVQWIVPLNLYNPQTVTVQCRAASGSTVPTKTAGGVARTAR